MAEGLTVAPAAATGIGSLPGVHTREWSITLAGELPDLPHVPELPGRGPGADMIGRTAGLLAAVAPDLAVATTPSGWRFTSSPGREMARAQSWLGEDLDGIEEALAGRAGILKAQLVGPWTLAAMIEMRTGERAVRDHGACRDLAGALAEASVRHIADLRRRLPGARIILQFDEPALPTVLAGGVSTASGMATYRSVDVQRAQLLLGQVFSAAHDAGAVPGVHCCDARAPIDLLRRSGAEMLSVDPAVLAEDQEESLGAAVEAGLLILLGYAERSLPGGHVSSMRAGESPRMSPMQPWRSPRRAVSPTPHPSGHDGPTRGLVLLDASLETRRLRRGRRCERLDRDSEQVDAPCRCDQRGA